MLEHRPSPVSGTAYVPSGKRLLNLTTGGRGIDVTDQVSVKQVRKFSSVYIDLPAALVRQYGGAARLTVAPMGSLIPLPVPGDTNLLGAVEIDRFTGPPRSVARQVFHDDRSTVAALSDLNQVINTMPERLIDDRARFKRSGGTYLRASPKAGCQRKWRKAAPPNSSGVS